MRRSAFQSLAISSLLLGGAVLSQWPCAFSAARPRYGGVLLLELGGRVASLGSDSGLEDIERISANKINSLVCDRLVRIDAGGRPQPALVLSWEHDSSSRRWEFRMRPGVKWHDGSPLTPADVAKVLGVLMGDQPQQVGGDTIKVETREPQPELPVLLATDPRFVVLRKPASPPEMPVATGPFRVTDWKPGQRIVLQANEDYWGGRPFLDGIQIDMGRSSRERLVDLELDRADLVELEPAEARRAQQEGRRVWKSAPLDLISLDFLPSKPNAQDQRLRRAIALSIDRSAIQKVLLQNYGEVAGGIFSEWLSGYAFLFPTAMDLEGARRLKTEIGAPPRLKLGYESGDNVGRAIAERVAVNAREAGILLQVAPLPQDWWNMLDKGVDARISRHRTGGPNLRAATFGVASTLGFTVEGKGSSLEGVYSAERSFLDSSGLVPLVHAEELVGLAPRIKGWAALPWGDWRVEEVWLAPKIE